MSPRAVTRGLSLFIFAVLVALPARAQTGAPGSISFSPATVTLGVGDTSPLVTAQVTYPTPPGAPVGGVQTLSFSYLPYGLTTSPSTVSFNVVAGQASATVAFRLVAAPFAYSTSGGEMSVYSTPASAYGLLNFVVEPLTVLPTATTVVAGSTSATLTATVSYGEAGPQTPQQLAFSGLPPGAVPEPSPVSYFVPPQDGYAVVSFNIVTDASTPAGNHSVTVGSAPYPTGTDTFVLTVLRGGGLGATMEKPSVDTCPGGAPAANSVTVTALGGYSGTPTVTFPALPADLKITPTSIPVATLPPSRTVAFEVAAVAGALPGQKVVNVRVSDPFGPSTTTSFFVNVGASDFLPVVSPTEFSLDSGGAPTTVTASLAPNSCSPPSRITVTPTGLPAGVTVTPSSADLVGPTYAPVVFTFAATAAAPAGNVPVAFTFTPSTGEPKAVDVPVTVTRTGRIGVEVERRTMDVCPGGVPGPNTLTISPIDGYAGTPTVTFPDLPAGLTVTPSTIQVPALPPSRIVGLSVSAVPGTAPGPVTVNVLVSDPRGVSATATFTANVLPPAYDPVVPTTATVLNAGGVAASVSVALTAGGCAPTGNVTVRPSGLPRGVTVTPESVLLEPPDFAPKPFSFLADGSAASGSSPVTFTYETSTGTPKTATATISVCGPPAAPVSPVVKPKGNPQGPVTATDFLDLSWGAPASGFSPTSYRWRINAGNPTATTGTTASAPPRGTVDLVQLFVEAYACSPERGPGLVASSPVYSLAAPVASFSVPASVVAGRPATFTDTSSPQATSWLWFPGDGMAATTVQSPTVTFPAAGPKVIVLVATNGSGSSTKATTVNVLAATSAREGASLAVRSMQRQADGRLALGEVEVAEGTTLLVRRLEGEGEAVAFLRFLDADGRVVVERRLVLAEGEEARHDLSAWGARGTFRVELVGPEGLDAAVEETAIRLGGPEMPVTPRQPRRGDVR